MEVLRKRRWERDLGKKRRRGKRLAKTNDLRDLGHADDAHDPAPSEPAVNRLDSASGAYILGPGKRRIDAGFVHDANAACVVDATSNPHDRGVPESIDLLEIRSSDPFTPPDDEDRGPIAASSRDDRIPDRRFVAAVHRHDLRRGVTDDRDRAFENANRVEPVDPALVRQPHQEVGGPRGGM